MVYKSGSLNKQAKMKSSGSTRTGAVSNFNLSELVSGLGNENGTERQRSRRALEEIGTAAVPLLIECLKDKDEQVRWEAAKALSHIKDPSSADALVETLLDEVPGIRWLAGEGLVKLKSAALVPLLRGLENHFDSLWFRQGAHHVLHVLADEEELNDEVMEVLEALSHRDPGGPAAIAAKRALLSLLGE